MDVDVHFVRKHLSYNPDTGVVTWKVPLGQRITPGTEVRRKDSKGYLRICFQRRKYLKLHRVVWLYHYGEWPDGFIDHINGVRDDNRLCNLRVTNAAGNSYNRGPDSDSKSPFKGITRHLKTGKWQAQIVHKGKAHYLGLFVSPEEAAKAYDAAARRFYGEFARANNLLEAEL